MPYHYPVASAISMIWWGFYFGCLGASLGALAGLFAQCAPSSGQTEAFGHPGRRRNTARELHSTSADRNIFAEQSESYARARPRYPTDLFRWIYGQCEDHGSAWDCATGNGQAAVSLATYFVRVDATDISARQIAQALPHPRVCYAVASAEASGLPGGQCDLVAVRRVTKPNAFFCAWGYDWPETTPAVDQGLIAPFRARLSPYWASNNRILWDGFGWRKSDFRLRASVHRASLSK
jgi:hypothetical protein